MRLFKAFLSGFAAGAMFIGLVFIVLVFGIITTLSVIVGMFFKIVKNDETIEMPFYEEIDAFELFIFDYRRMIAEIYDGGLFEQKQ